MKMNSDPEKQEPLLDALLQDENWQSVDKALKAEALATFRARHRARRLTRWTASLAALIVMVGGLALWLAHPAAPPAQRVARLAGGARIIQPKPRGLTDQELLAAFPKGSCFIAEVDGRKELVFLDPATARTYFAPDQAAGK